jgi:hypothetical protein
MVSIHSYFNTVERIKELIANLSYLETVDSGSNISIDIIEFATPLAVAPVASIINKKGLKYDYTGENASYLRVIRFPEGIDELEGLSLQSTYIPIIHLNLKNLNRRTLSEQLNRLHSRFLELLKLKVIGDERFIELITNNTFGFLLGELLDNIEEHSEAENVYLFAQYWSKTNSCEVCLLDDGIGLYGSLKKAGRDVKDSADSLKKVLEMGLSAKEGYSDLIRGTGIKNTRAAITNKEINGEFMIMSGNISFLHSASNGQSFFNFTEYSWKGTLVLMKLNKPITTFNLYNYVK